MTCMAWLMHYFFAGPLGYFEHNPAEVEHVASDSTELSTRQNFASNLAGREVLRGWALRFG
jgi:hypothetical protein